MEGKKKERKEHSAPRQFRFIKSDPFWKVTKISEMNFPVLMLKPKIDLSTNLFSEGCTDMNAELSKEILLH